MKSLFIVSLLISSNAYSFSSECLQMVVDSRSNIYSSFTIMGNEGVNDAVLFYSRSLDQYTLMKSGSTVKIDSNNLTCSERNMSAGTVELVNTVRRSLSGQKRRAFDQACNLRNRPRVPGVRIDLDPAQQSAQ